MSPNTGRVKNLEIILNYCADLRGRMPLAFTTIWSAPMIFNRDQLL